MPLIDASPPAYFSPSLRTPAVVDTEQQPTVGATLDTNLTRSTATRAGVPLDALAKSGELGFLGPNGEPRLVALSPVRPGAPVFIFIHGIGGDPCNQEILIRKAQARGMQVYVMAYNTFAVGGEANAKGFADEFRRLADEGTHDVTIVSHSLGALTTKAALANITGQDGHLQAFDHLRYFALSAPWGGVNVADLSLQMLTAEQKLSFARDLAPGSTYWQGLINRRLPPEVDFYNVQGSIDQFKALAWGRTRKLDLKAVLAESKRVITLPGGTHNSGMWDPRAAAFIFDPEHAADPARLPGPSLAHAIARELQACAGVRDAFRPRRGEI
jgi:hypothetical protein